MKASMLDLGCGLGGASQAMRERGWQVVGVDLNRTFHPTIQADALSLPVRGQFDLAWASPPCNEFSTMNYIRSKGLNPSRAAINLALGMAAAVREHGHWWVVENVRGAESFLNPHLGQPRRFGPWRLWGNAPMAIPPRIPHKLGAMALSRTQLSAADRLWKTMPKRKRAAEAARVPRGISLALAIGVERSLEGAWLH